MRVELTGTWVTRLCGHTTYVLNYVDVTTLTEPGRSRPSLPTIRGSPVLNPVEPSRSTGTGGRIRVSVTSSW